MRKGLFLALLAVLSALASVYGLGLSYSRLVTPRSANGELSQIHGDGWIVTGSEIRLGGLAPRGNQLELNLNNWRPGTSEPARLTASLCGEPVSILTVDTVGSRTIYLTGECEPRTVSFQVHNPVRGSPTDDRDLGVQLNYFRLTSRLGVPVVDVAVLLQCWALIFSVSLIYYRAFRASGARYASAALPAFALLILDFSRFPDYTNAFSLWLLVASVGVGMLLAGAAGEGGRFLLDSRARPADPERGFPAWLVPCVVFLGAALRFYGLGFGLPNNYHPDEVPKVNALIRMAQHGNLDPQYFLHPSLLLYSTYGMNWVLDTIGMNQGSWPYSAFLAGRVVSACAGTLSILFVYLIGRRLYSRSAGLVSAAVIAGLPLHVTCSRYLKEDALLLCVILACVLAMLKAVQEDRKGFLFLSGLLAGVSASTKYSGMLSIMIVLSAPWVRSRSWKPDVRYLRLTLLACLLAPVGFVICTPYSILNYKKFIYDFRSEKQHMMRGHTSAIDAWSQFWMFHLTNSIVPGMSYVTTVCALIGVGFLLWRRRVEDLLLICLILLFYMPAEWVKAKPAPQPDRYILPCLPFLAIAAGEILGMLSRTVVARRLAPVLVLLAVIVPSARSIQLSSEIRDDTRTQMARWMAANLPRGSKIYMDWKPYCPRFWNDEFDVTYVPRATIMQYLNVRDLKLSGQDYLVLSSLFYDRYFSQPDATPAFRQRFRDIFNRVPIVKQIRPKYGTYGFHNPTLTVFSLKKEDFARLEHDLALKQAGKIDRTINEMRASLRWQERR